MDNRSVEAQTESRSKEKKTKIEAKRARRDMLQHIYGKKMPRKMEGQGMMRNKKKDEQRNPRPREQKKSNMAKQRTRRVTKI